LVSTLDHPHLIRLHELSRSRPAWCSCSISPAWSLADLLTRRGRLTPGEVITALSPIGAALAYAHNEGVVHGDVTPANVLFTEIGLPLLADLGWRASSATTPRRAVRRRMSIRRWRPGAPRGPLATFHAGRRGGTCAHRIPGVDGVNPRTRSRGRRRATSAIWRPGSRSCRPT